MKYPAQGCPCAAVNLEVHTYVGDFAGYSSGNRAGCNGIFAGIQQWASVFDAALSQRRRSGDPV